MHCNLHKLAKKVKLIISLSNTNKANIFYSLDMRSSPGVLKLKHTVTRKGSFPVNRKKKTVKETSSLVGPLSEKLRYRRLPLPLNWILPSSGLLPGVRWFETDVLGLPNPSHLQGSSCPKRKTAWPLKMGPKGSTETSVSNHLTLRNNPGDVRIPTSCFNCVLQHKTGSMA